MSAVHDRDPASWSVRDPGAHAAAVRGMFARIARVYDAMNHLLSFNLDRRWRRRLAARLDGDVWEVLDACAGTGDLALACLRAGKGRLLLAADFCPEMLALARRKGLGGEHAAPGAVPRSSVLLAGDALNLPLPDASCDAVVTAFGMRNLADVPAGVRELMRVLRPGGQLLVLEFFRDDPGAAGDQRGPPRPLRWWLGLALPWLGRLLARDGAAYGYLPASVDRFLTVAEFCAVMRESGLRQVAAERMILGVAHLCAGRR